MKRDRNSNSCLFALTGEKVGLVHKRGARALYLNPEKSALSHEPEIIKTIRNNASSYPI